MIDVHDEATADLRAIAAVNPAAAGKLAAFIQQLRASSELQAKLHEKEWGEDRVGPLGVKQWSSMHKETKGKPVRRLRAWELEAQGIGYRLLTIYDYTQQAHTILAVVARDKQSCDYDDPNQPVRRRIFTCIQRDFARA